MNKINVQICSHGRSGSTLLDLILGAHSQCISTGEINHLPKNIALNSLCSCGSNVQQCEHWSKLLNRLGERLRIDVFNNPYSLNLGFHVASTLIDEKHQTLSYKVRRKYELGRAMLILKFGLPEFIHSNEFKRFLTHLNELYELLHEDYDVIIDSSKSYGRALSLHGSSFVSSKSKLILLSRNGLAVLNSRMKSGFDTVDSINQWKRYYKRFFWLSSDFPKENIIHVKYEDLVNMPHKTVNQICDFLGIPFELEMIESFKSNYHLLNGNNMLFDKKNRQLVEDLTWQKNLDEQTKRLFYRMAGELQRQLGYQEGSTA